MKEKNKDKSALVWFLSTVPICVAPFVLTYLFRSYTSGKLLDIKQYTNDILLMICSIACGLMVLAFDSSKYISEKMRIGSRIYSCFVALISGSFYFYIAGLGKNVKDYIIFIVGIILSVSCIIVGIVLGINHDINKRKSDVERINKCREFFKEAIPAKYESAFVGIEEVGFCEMKGVNPVERLQAEKKNKK